MEFDALQDPGLTTYCNDHPSPAALPEVGGRALKCWVLGGIPGVKSAPALFLFEKWWVKASNPDYLGQWRPEENLERGEKGSSVFGGSQPGLSTLPWKEGFRQQVCTHLPHPKAWSRERRHSAGALPAWRVSEMALSLFIHLFIHL